MKTYNIKLDWLLCMRLQYNKSLSTLHSQVKQQSTKCTIRQKQTARHNNIYKVWGAGSEGAVVVSLPILLGCSWNKINVTLLQSSAKLCLWSLRSKISHLMKTNNLIEKMMSNKLQHHQSVLFLTFLFALLLCRNDSKWVAATVTQ